MLSHDAKLRCDLVDLYYTLYGIKVPFCLPAPEFAMLTKPRKAGPPSSPEREVKYCRSHYTIIKCLYNISLES